jgi:cytochrome c553
MKSVFVILFLVAQSLYAASTLLESPDSLAKRLAASGGTEHRFDIPVSRQPSIPERLHYPLSDLTEISIRIGSRVQHCEQCHSPVMARRNGYLPVLQGQQREYLFSKIMSFKTQRDSRHPFPMYSQKLDWDEVIDIALYYALQPSALRLGLLRIEPGWRQETEEIEHSIAACLECHGNDGNGAGLIPALSGQNPKYLGYRMREISGMGSHVHVYSEAPVSCQIQTINVRQSNQMAARFALVLDETRLVRGQSIFKRWCHSCHDSGGKNAPRLDTGFDWQTRLEAGVSEYALDSVERPLLVHKNHIGTCLSQNQWADVLHYLLAQVSISR